MASALHPQSVPARQTLSVKQAAEILGLSVRTLYSYCRRKIVPSVRVGRKVVILQSTIDAFLAAGALPEAAPAVTAEPEPAAADPSVW